MSKELKCILRKELVPATPEEYIRQACLQEMLNLDYPASLIVVERSLSQLISKVNGIKLPKRRMDIVCFTNTYQKELSPLILIECKAKTITKSAITQVLGYNYYIKAPFVACMSSSNFFLFSSKPSSLYPAQFQKLLPYKTLIELLAIERK